MALHVAQPGTDDVEVELIGIRLDGTGPPRYRDLKAEVKQLRALINAKDAHIASLETQVWAWRSQAANEARVAKAAQGIAWERECELVRVIHRQVIAQQQSTERRAWAPRSVKVFR